MVNGRWSIVSEHINITFVIIFLETLCDKMICILRRKDYISEV